MSGKSKVLSLLKWAVPSFLILIVISLVIVHSYINTTGFVNRLTPLLEDFTGFDITIGSINLSGFSSITINNVDAQGRNNVDPHLSFKSLRVDFSPLGLLRRTVDTVRLEAPYLYIDISKRSKETSAKPVKPAKQGRAVEPSLPIRFNSVVIKDLAVDIKYSAQRARGSMLRAGPVDIRVDSTQGNKAKVKVKAKIDGLSSPVKIETEVNLAELALAGGRVDLGTIQLSELSDILGERLAVASLTGGFKTYIEISNKTDGAVVLDIHSDIQGFAFNEIEQRQGRKLDAKLSLALTASADFKDVNINMALKGTSRLFQVEDHLSATLKGSYDIEEKSFKLINALINSSIVGSISAKGIISAVATDKMGLDIGFTTKGLALGEVGNHIDALQKLSGKVTGRATLKGVLARDLRWSSGLRLSGLSVTALGFDFAVGGRGVRLDSSGSIKGLFDTPVIDGTSRLKLTQGSFTDIEGIIMGENINIDIKKDFVIKPAFGTVTAKIKARVGGFELLAGSFYANFAGKEVALSVKSGYELKSDRLTIKNLTLALDKIARLALKGSVKGARGGKPSFDISIALKELNNKEAFDIFVKETFQDSITRLADITMDGRTAFDMRLWGRADAFKAEGLFKIKDTNIIEDRSEGARHSLRDINGSIPVSLSYPSTSSAEADKKDKPKKYGYLKVGSIEFDAVEIQGLQVFPVIWNNTLDFREDIVIPIFAGKITLNKLRYDNLLRTARELSLSINIDSINLGEMSAALGLPVFSGALSGTIPMATLKGATFRSEGLIKLNLFDGELRARAISIDNLFSPITSIKSSIEVDSLNLEKLTRTFEFGRITGILSGYIQDLVITNGQPQSFVVQIETKKKRGVKQEINVAALKKISVFSSGSSISVLDRGIYKLFKQYRYARLGFSGRLRNDTFTLLGVEMENNKRYIVKGSAMPPTVNVISYTREISFSEMVKRLQRINHIE